jgi:hypothetical protein
MKNVLLTQLKRTFIITCMAGGSAFAQTAPNALDASDILNGSCHANWEAFAGATGYRIDVSTQPDFSEGLPLPWINEFKYNTSQETAEEFFEVVVPNNYTVGTNLTVTLYDNNGHAYATSPMSEWTTGLNAPAGHTVKYKVMDIEAFGPAYLGGLALSHTVGSETKLIQYISFGSYPIIAADGPAAGETSQQVPSPSILNHSSRVYGIGGRYMDFQWETGTVSKGLKNNNQTLTPAQQYDAFVAPYNNYDCGNNLQVPLNGLNGGTTYYYRVRAMSGATVSDNSNTIMFSTLAPHIWSNNTWTRNGVETVPPTVNDDVIIEDDFEFSAAGDGTFAARSLVLLSGSLHIQPGYTLNVRRGITNYMSDAEFIVENNANIIQENSDSENIGDITIRKNSSMLYKLDYTVWSSPVIGQNLQSFSPLTLPHRFYTYNTAIQEYESTNVNEDFEVGKGYLIRMPDTWPTAGYNEGTTPIIYSGEFKGVPQNGTVIVPVEDSNQGINMIGNPYPSPINVHTFFDQNVLSLNESSPIWVWRKRNNPDATSYATITKAGYTANYAIGGDTSAGQFNSNSSENWVLNPGQGFFVRVKPGVESVIFTNGMRRAINNNQFFRNDGDNDEETIVSRIKLDIQGENEFHAAQAIVAYSDQTTLGIDYGWDGQFLNSGKVKLYTKVNDTKLAIQARPTFTVEDIVPLMLEVINAGSYTIKLDQVTGVFEGGQKVYLKDNMTGVIHNLSDTDYTFTTEAGSFENRFELMYTPQALSIDPVAELNNIVVYKQGNTININSGSVEMNGVTVYDMRGRVLFNDQTLTGNEASINSLTSSQEVLLVQISSPTSGTVTKKIIF